LIKLELQDQLNAICHQYKNVTSLVEVDNFYATIHCWWLSSGATSEVGVHELANWLNFWHFCVRQWGSFMVHVSISLTNFIWLHSKLKFHLHLNSICTLPPSRPPSMLWHFRFCWCFLSFDLQKFNDEEWVEMPICNLTKIVHNI